MSLLKRRHALDRRCKRGLLRFTWVDRGIRRGTACIFIKGGVLASRTGNTGNCAGGDYLISRGRGIPSPSTRERDEISTIRPADRDESKINLHTSRVVPPKPPSVSHWPPLIHNKTRNSFATREGGPKAGGDSPAIPTTRDSARFPATASRRTRVPRRAPAALERDTNRIAEDEGGHVLDASLQGKA